MLPFLSLASGKKTILRRATAAPAAMRRRGVRQFNQWAIRGANRFYSLANVHVEMRGGVLAATARDFDGDIGVSVFDRQSGAPLGRGSAAGD